MSFLSRSNDLSASSPLRARLLASLTHLLLSALIAGALAAVVFMLWYPMPQRQMVGGTELFWLVVGVDVVMGPLLTLVVFNANKGRAHLARDLVVIAALQLSALAYGAHTVWLARPAILAFEIDRIRVVTAADIDPKSLAQEAMESLRSLPWGAPRMVSAIKPTQTEAFSRSFDLSMAGIDLGMQPGTWREFDDSQRKAMWDAARPVEQLVARLEDGSASARLNEAIQAATASGASAEKLRYLPIVSKQTFWTALINDGGAVVGYASVDPF